jgi:uncharacterized spore protein YtfJ
MQAPEFQGFIGGVRDLLTVKRVYGDAYEKNGLTVIPAASIRGGGGGGEGRRGAEESGTGGGFGVLARPSGAWVIADGKVEWRPAIDVNRIVLGGQIVALAAILVAGRIRHAHSVSERQAARRRALALALLARALTHGRGWLRRG